MTYVAWAALYEGTSDQRYFDILLPRIMDELILRRGTRHVTIPAAPAITFSRGTSDSVAAEICEGREAYHVVFVHADTGGRALEANMAGRGTDICAKAHELCNWQRERCVLVAPRHEVEAWVLADPTAVCGALGYSGQPQEIGLPASPQEAEALVDPKAALVFAMKKVRGRKKPIDPSQLFPAIAQQQDLRSLRRLQPFKDLENSTARALRSLGCF